MSDAQQDDHVDFRIAHDGTWYHNGAPIKRAALAKLFADRALKIDAGGNYWLQTPYEKYPVTVEDVPFIITDYEEEDGAVIVRTNMGETVTIGPDHPLELRVDKTSGDELPYVEVRDGLYARLGRNVYYAFVNKYGENLVSHNVDYPLGRLDEGEE